MAMHNWFGKIGTGSSFYLTRLRRASLAELQYRLRHAGRRLKTGWLVSRGRNPCSAPAISPSTIRSLALPSFSGEVTRSTVDQILAGYRFTLNADLEAVQRCEQELRQRYCPPIRPRGSQVDIRAVWESARLQHLTLLLAYCRQYPASPDDRAIKEFVRRDILTWLADNRFPLGPHYLSAMECGLRIPVLFYALKILDELNSSETEQLCKGIFHHAWWIEQNLSLYSSLGNHTVCEALGLVFAGSMYRGTEIGKRWLKTGITLLSQELPRQVLGDGGPVEQAFGYHRFVLDIYWLAVDFLERNSLRDCNDLMARLLAGEGFFASFGDSVATIPAVGDYDDGHAVAPGISPRRLVSPEQWPRCRTFSTSGYTVVRGTGDLLLTFDHGPLGMAPLYNHGHADALSVTLSIGGTPFLVDAGTYRYNGAPDFRRYFKGTRAHNTVIIDGEDQAIQLTGFVWGKPYTGQLVHTDITATSLLLEGSHDGYSRLKNRVRHFRSLLHADDGSWLITDFFQGSGQHTFELNFHLHPAVKVVPYGNGWLLERNGRRVRFELANGEFLQRRGEENPPLGWFSPAYNLKEPAPVLQIARSGDPAVVRFETRITIV